MCTELGFQDPTRVQLPALDEYRDNREGMCNVIVQPSTVVFKEFLSELLAVYHITEGKCRLPHDSAVST
jgi:hypothetical protein